MMALEQKFEYLALTESQRRLHGLVQKQNEEKSPAAAQL